MFVDLILTAYYSKRETSTHNPLIRGLIQFNNNEHEYDGHSVDFHWWRLVWFC
jgi:hypothetical protein